MNPSLLSCILLACAALAAPVAATPFVPDADTVVLERLPEQGDPALVELKRLRAAAARAPGEPTLAALAARRAIDAARATGDPRFLGQAQAALAPWWSSVDAPAPILVLRATIRQSLHDFPGALADLDRVLAARPGDGQALLTRATVLTVQGRYDEAKRDCARLAPLTIEAVAAACFAGPASLTGDAAAAYGSLRRALARGGDDPGVRAWVLTLAAEIAVRRGDAVAGDHFRAALAADPRDPYAKGAYADWLLDYGHPQDVVALLDDDVRNDALLLRLALAEARLPARATQAAAHRAELAARFAASRQRGDTVHRREEARYRLLLEHDAAGAVALARANWDVQKEPADLRILAEAARAAGDADALRTATAWIAAHRLEDATIVARAGDAR